MTNSDVTYYWYKIVDENVDIIGVHGPDVQPVPDENFILITEEEFNQICEEYGFLDPG